MPSKTNLLLKSFLARCGLTQAAAARTIGVSEATFSRTVRVSKMSANRKGGQGFSPSFTFSQFEQMAEFFKQLLAENPLVKASIIAAGIGGALEGLHILWLALRYLAKF